MQQRALEREPLAQAARERADAIVGASVEPRRGQRRRRRAPSRSRHAVQPAEELEVLARRQVAVQEQVVAEHADARRAARRPIVRGRPIAVADVARASAAASVESMPSSVDLPAPFGPNRPTISSGAARERDARQRAPAAVVPRDVARPRRVEIDGGRDCGDARLRRRRRRRGTNTAAQMPTDG